MKRRVIYHIFISVLFLCVIPKHVLAQEMTTIGTDFWTTCIIHTNRSESNEGTHHQNYLYLTGPRKCSATITDIHTGHDTIIQIAPDTLSVVGRNFFDFHRPIISHTIHDYSVHITATDSISVYFEMECATSESANILPTHALRSDYLIQVYPSTQANSVIKECCCFSILAVEDNTTVVIDITDSTNSGDTSGSTFTVLLPSAGDCYEIISPPNGDLSGSRVTALNNKKIAVFQGNNNALVPPTASFEGGLYEQALPINYWGRHFFVPKTDNAITDRVRITSLYDNNIIQINNRIQALLQSGETFEYGVSPLTPVDYISTSKKAYVVRYTSGNIGYSDPTMLTIIPWELSAEAINFCFPTYSRMFITNMDSAYIDIIMKTSETNMLLFNGNSIASLFSTVTHNQTFSHAQFRLESGAYSLYTNDGEGFVASVFFKGQGRGFSYPAGSALRDMFNSLKINETEDVTWMDTIIVCDGNEVNMRVESLFIPDSIVWHLGDGTHTTGEQINHTFPSARTYTITAIVYADCNGCYRQIDTLTGSIRILPPDTTLRDTLCCDLSYTWNDSTYYDGEQIHIMQQNVYGCDSLIIMTLHMVHSSTALIDTVSGCDSVILRNVTYYNDTIVPFDTLQNYVGCDSIILRAIHILPSYIKIQEETIRDTTTFEWIDGNTYSETTYEPYVVLHSHQGCDSIIILHLNVLPLPPTEQIDNTSIWAPNTFTPEEKTNNRFFILGNDIFDVEVSIFSREGIHICTFDGLNDSWDGTFRSKACPQGVYVYKITYKTKTMPRIKHVKTGTVLLLR